MKYLLIILILGVAAFGQNAYGPDYLNLHCTTPDSRSNTLFGIPPQAGLVPNTSANGNLIVYCDSTSGALKTSVNGSGYVTVGSGVPTGGSFGNYTFSVSGGTVTAVNNATGAIAFSGTDTAAVFNSVTSANATTGARLFFKTGVYPINSMTLDSTTGCSNFNASGNALAYAMAFPSNTNLATSVQWLIEGEGNPVWAGETGTTTVNTNGVIFNVTSTAVSSVAANSVLAAFWQRPITNCTLTVSATTNNSNDVYFSNIAVRFPTNQRGNEIGVAAYFLSDVGYSNVLADFALPYNSIATGSAPVVGSYNSIGLTSTVSGSGNVERFDRTYAVGYNIGYDWQSEHVTSNSSTAIYNNFPAWLGRSSSTVLHPMVIEKFTDQENLNGIQLGSSLGVGTQVNIFGLDMELGSANWYARTASNLTEVTPGNSSGIITYTAILQGSGLIHPTTGLFVSGGQKFLQINSGATNPTIFPPGVDSFTRSNGSAPGSGWQNLNGANPCGTISSNSFTSASGAALCGWFVDGTLTDQFSKATVNTLDANGVTVGVRATGTTYYDYFCNGTASGRAIRSRISGTFTTLASTASNCTTGNTLELVVIGSSLFGYYAGNLDLTATDTNITSGVPAVIVGGTGDSFTNWTGGAVPQRDANRSLFNSPIFSSHEMTVSNCQLGGATGTASPAACGSATAGSIAIPASQTSYVVNTTQVNAGSHIFVQQITDNSGISTATCNSGATTPIQSTRTVGTSFTITLTSVASVTCFQYWIVD